MSDDVMIGATAVARAALEGKLLPQVAGATHYHADYVTPYWAPGLVRIAQIGRHIFYRMPGARDLGSFPGLQGSAVEPEISGLMPIPADDTISPIRLTQAQSAPTKHETFAPWGLNIVGDFRH